ncbi:MAG TPA: ParB/RepB/Spo0J family partition protein [Nevskiaceae bacterium]|nr:ParB/RepB/Spo0J family partition protein [Nevskiaceae bacterium]
MPEASTFARETAAMPVEQISLDLISVQDQIRKNFDPDKLEQLGQSIKQHGLVQPIVVAPENNGTGMRLLMGERRLRAAKAAGLTTLPTIVRHDLAGQDVRVLQAIENLQREDLTMAEECAGVTALVESIGFEATCQQLCKSESWVSKRSTIKQLPAPIKDLVEQGKVKDLEVVHLLGQLAKHNSTKAFELARMARVVDDAGNLPAHQQPTRENISALVRAERETAERKQQEKIERDAAKNDPAAIKAKKRDASAKEERKQLLAKLQQLKDAGTALEDETMEALGKALGIKVPPRGEFGGRGHCDVMVAMDYLQEHMKLPASVDGAGFTFRADGSVSLLKSVCKLTAHAQKLAITIREVSVDQAEKIAAIVGEKAVTVGLVKRVNGKELRSYIERARAAKHEAKTEKREAAKEGPEYQLAKLREFLRKHVTVIGGKEARLNTVTAKAMYGAYAAYCQANKVEPLSLNDNAYGAAILAHAGGGIVKKRTNTGYVYVGCSLA